MCWVCRVLHNSTKLLEQGKLRLDVVLIVRVYNLLNVDAELWFLALLNLIELVSVLFCLVFQ